METFLGILIPFLGTALGSACVFFMKKSLGDLVQRSLAGFAAGGDGGGVDMESADPCHRAIGGHGQAVFPPGLYRLLGRRAVFAHARSSDSPISMWAATRQRGRKAGWAAPP